MPLTAAEEQELADLKAKLAQMQPVPGQPVPGPLDSLESSSTPAILRSFLGNLGRNAVDAGTTYASMLPGPLGMAGAGGGSIAQDLMRGESPDLGRAGASAALVGGLGLLGKLAGPLSKLRIGGMGKSADAALAADAVRGAGTSLQPGGTTPELMNVMRGMPGQEALGAARGVSQDAVASQLPSRAVYPAPTPTPMPAMTKEDYGAASGTLADLGNRGFSRGMFRDSPEAIAARSEHGARLQDLLSKLEQQGGPGLRQAEEAGRQDFSAGTEMRRLFRPNTGEGPDRVFRPGGFNMQDLQERAVKRVPEIQGRLGQTAGDAFLSKLLRGGQPGEGTDRPLSISSSKFGGFRLPLGLQILAGPQMDSRMLQMLLQSGGPSLLDALRQ